MEIEDYVDVAINNSEKIFLVDLPSDKVESIAMENKDIQFYTNVQSEYQNENITVIYVNDIFRNVEQRVRFLVSLGVEDELVLENDMVAVISESDVLGGHILTVTEAESMSVSPEMRSLFFDSKPDATTVQSTLDIAASLARTGQKGEPVGALFVLGDEDEVLNRSRPLNYNPFGSSDVHIGDDVVSASIGEYAKLDGAFIISDAGRIISANRYLEPRVRDAEVPSGLGARHMAASGITRSTDAVAIVVSESDQKIRCFVDGEIVMTSNPLETSI